MSSDRITLLAAAAGLLCAVVFVGLHYLCCYLAYRRSRNVWPAPGQVWAQGDVLLEIEAVQYGALPRRPSLVKISLGHRMSWTESFEAWESRVRHRRLFLVNKACPV